MCEMNELVRVVDDTELATAWVAATAQDGQRVVFVREGDQSLIGTYCALGTGRCPVYQAFARRSAALA